MTLTLHVIVREEAGAWWAWSPSAPGLFAAADTGPQLREMLPGAVTYWAGEEGIADEFVVLAHLERLTEDGLALRVAQDAHLAERDEVFSRVLRALTIPDQKETLLSAHPSSSGEPLIVMVTAQDTMGWIASQMASEDHVLAAAAIADEHFVTFDVATGDQAFEVPAEPVESFETVGDVLKHLEMTAPGASRRTFSLGRS